MIHMMLDEDANDGQWYRWLLIIQLVHDDPGDFAL